MKVTLGKAVRLPGRRLFRSGEVVDVTESEAEFITRLGADAATAPVVVEDVAPTVTPASADDSDDGEDEGPEKPPKSASAERWREYLTAVGINPSGLSKREMIAAVK